VDWLRGEYYRSDDPKPVLAKYDGQPYPGGELETHFDKQKGNCLGSPYKFQKFGQCGMDLCELLPQTGSIADDICLVRSMKTGVNNPLQSLYALNSGSFRSVLTRLHIKKRK
jgi:hypothetical protein